MRHVGPLVESAVFSSRRAPGWPSPSSPSSARRSRTGCRCEDTAVARRRHVLGGAQDRGELGDVVRAGAEILESLGDLSVRARRARCRAPPARDSRARAVGVDRPRVLRHGPRCSQRPSLSSRPSSSFEGPSHRGPCVVRAAAPRPRRARGFGRRPDTPARRSACSGSRRDRPRRRNVPSSFTRASTR